MNVVIVNLVGLVLIGLIVWYFWLSRPQGSLAAVGAGGVQEAFIVVKGGYSPDTITVEAGQPVKLVFNRQEADPCSEKVVFDAFGVSADLPEGENVPIEITPSEPGEYEFACQMGMLRGKLVAS
ncbi:MAG TPA: cupredoxin domain-containing protein [Acidimicrobiia bacterium]